MQAPYVSMATLELIITLFSCKLSARVSELFMLLGLLKDKKADRKSELSSFLLKLAAKYEF